MTAWRLDIQRAPLDPLPWEGETSWKALRGGPEVLLSWLETQLGLRKAPLPHSTRILRYAALLANQAAPSYKKSFETDRWMTASDLLRKRDLLREAGWAGEKGTSLPPLVSDLAEIEDGTRKTGGHAADRIDAVLSALESGQTLPEHTITLRDPVEAWPPKWRELLGMVKTAPAKDTSPSPDSPLGKVQASVFSGKTAPIVQDASLRWLRFGSRQSAAEGVARALKELGGPLSEVTVLSEDPDVAALLDEALAALGLPTMGVSLKTRAHPALQILPLVTALSWDPIHPQLLLDFLSLPVGPIPRRVGRPLSEALQEEPGLGSDAWQEAVKELTDKKNDPDGKKKKLLTTWFEGDWIPRGTPLPTEHLSKRCRLLSQWAAGYATFLADSGKPGDTLLAVALQQVAGQAASLTELAGAQGETVSEPQLARLLDAVLSEGSSISGEPRLSGGPRWISSLSELSASTPHLIWLGLGTASGPHCPFTRDELDSLRKAKIEVDDGARELAALRNAERRGLGRISRSLLAVSLPADRDVRPHPIWLQMFEGLKAGKADAPVSASDLFSGLTECDTSPWAFPTAEATLLPPPPPRPLWKIDPKLLVDREKRSASSLTDRLACPLKWTFTYQAKLRSGPITSLPSDFLLKGTFCHRILETVFGKGGALPSTQDGAKKVTAAFDEALPRNAAPLAQPDKAEEARTLRRELERSTEVLLETLRAGGYEIVSMEDAFDTEIAGRRTIGFLDCLVEKKSTGDEGIIDFKYGGSGKYRGLLEQGRAVQLALYAASRGDGKKKSPAVAYLILSRGLLLTPKPNALPGIPGAGILAGAPSMAEVWTRFQAAVEAADGWLTSGDPIPARPLQDESDLPEGYELTIRPDKGRNDELEVCKYCDFGLLCGRKELT